MLMIIGCVAGAVAVIAVAFEALKIAALCGAVAYWMISQAV
ncbi:hypothetical protein [Bradyrhizobium glycinis]|nr:hypothetical protein [Bradyrhizobium glycinis]